MTSLPPPYILAVLVFFAPRRGLDPPEDPKLRSRCVSWPNERREQSLHLISYRFFLHPLTLSLCQNNGEADGRTTCFALFPLMKILP